MKKLLVTITFLLAVGVQAQNAKKAAKYFSSEMTKLFELSETDTKKAYDIFFNNYTSQKSYKVANEDKNKKEIRQGLAPIRAELSKELTALVGKKNYKKWMVHMKELRSKKK